MALKYTISTQICDFLIITTQYTYNAHIYTSIQHAASPVNYFPEQYPIYNTQRWSFLLENFIPE